MLLLLLLLLLPLPYGLIKMKWNERTYIRTSVVVPYVCNILQIYNYIYIYSSTPQLRIKQVLQGFVVCVCLYVCVYVYLNVIFIVYMPVLHDITNDFKFTWHVACVRATKVDCNCHLYIHAILHLNIHSHTHKRIHCLMCSYVVL